MMRRRSIPLAFGAAILLFTVEGACRGPRSSTEDEAGDLEDPAVTTAVSKVITRLAAEAIAGRPERWIELWDEHAILIARGSPIAVGSPSIRNRLADLLSRTRILDLQLTAGEVASDGDLAVATGRYTELTADGARSSGDFLAVLARDARGAWRLYRCGFDSDPFGGS